MSQAVYNEHDPFAADWLEELMRHGHLPQGVPGRVGLLRGYGNSIVPQVACEFILSSLEALAQCILT